MLEFKASLQCLEENIKFFLFFCKILFQSLLLYIGVKAAAKDMRYFARSKFSKSLVHKKNFGLIWPVVFKLEYLFCQGRWDTSF